MGWARRTKKKAGFVNFPVNSKEYKSSGEGGLFVRLVVPEKMGPTGGSWMVCSCSKK